MTCAASVSTALEAAFASRIKTKQFETFNSIFIVDFASCDAEQTQLLVGLLLADNGDEKSTEKWHNYVSYAMNKYSSKKSQLQRLVNKALEMVNELADCPFFVGLHLFSAQLKL